MDQKKAKLTQKSKNQSQAFNFKPNLISRPYRDGLDHNAQPFQERLYNHASEYEMKKEELRRNKTDNN